MLIPSIYKFIVFEKILSKFDSARHIFAVFRVFFRDFHIRLTSRYSFSDSSYNSASIDIQQAYVLTHSLEARSMSCSWWRH